MLIQAVSAPNKGFLGDNKGRENDYRNNEEYNGVDHIKMNAVFFHKNLSSNWQKGVLFG